MTIALTFFYLFFLSLCGIFDYFFFFFQAEDGIRDDLVTGVQTCALPISRSTRRLVIGRWIRELSSTLTASDRQRRKGKRSRPLPAGTARAFASPLLGVSTRATKAPLSTLRTQTSFIVRSMSRSTRPMLHLSAWLKATQSFSGTAEVSCA